MRKVLFVASLSLVISCATPPPQKARKVVQKKIAAPKKLPPANTTVAKKSISIKDSIRKIEALTIEDVVTQSEPSTRNLYDNSRYDFPITINSKVEGWMDYFTGRGRRHFERYLSRSSRYIPLMKHILRNEGLPEDLVYLAMIESGFNMRAYSKAAAVGPWQFIRGTGKRYGLRIDQWIDERQDPVRATEAAAKYLKDLYLMFESWYLAAAAYNAGEYKILRAVKALKTNNYWRISQTRYIRRETKDYVPKLIAAAILAKNPTKYNFDTVEYQDPLDFETVILNFPIRLNDLAKMVNTTTSLVASLNPEIRRGMLPPGTKDYVLRVPVGTQAIIERTLATRKTELTRSARPPQYKVRRGDNLYKIARRYGISVNSLMRANNITRRTVLHVGRRLVLPTHARAKRSSRKITRRKRKLRPFIRHTVKRGESLWSIAERYNVTVQQLFRWNKLKRSKIHPGKKLRLRPRIKDA